MTRNPSELENIGKFQRREMWDKARQSIIWLCALTCLLVSIAPSLAEVPATNQPTVDFSNTWLLHLPGIGGELPIDHDMTDGLKDAGWAGPITIYDWTEHDPGLDALLARKRNEREAAKVAKMIEEKLAKDPTLKITITSHSAGTGIAIWALEKLPEGMKVEQVLLLASAISPDYDLSKALSHVRGKMYSFYSANDTLVLGAGTKMFGTVDGKNSVAAGLIGFTQPKGASDEEYAKLVQRPWLKQWMAFDNVGSHIGCMSELFGEKVLGPLLIKGLGPTSSATTKPVARD